MSRLKKGFKIVSLLMILVVAAAAPLIATELNNRSLIDKPNITTMSPEPVEEEPADEYDTVSRLQALIKANGVVTERQKVKLSKEERESLVAAAQEQLIILQDASALPKLDFSNGAATVFPRQTYMDIQNPNYTMSTWGMHIAYPDFWVYALMDAETFTIYEVTVSANVQYLNYDPAEVSVNGFLKYLEMDSEKSNWGGRESGIGKYYVYDKESQIGYYCEKTQKHVMYTLVLEYATESS